ncbi:hypothetical protein [Pseudomonas putida]|uniref:Uncharacterized protein n=1 Tax=Pseudomonas putida TaxID=303 RepID=A0A6I6XJ94_PSEPU|nr:hypothetical protein [Pseudomonas putida]QHG63935.1 hypothetical protein C2H86_05650 [Pseudomonas putida]
MERSKDAMPERWLPIVMTQVWYSLLNDCWQAYYLNNEFAPGEALLLDRDTQNGVRKVASVVFGHPRMTWSDETVETRKRLLSEREAVFMVEPGLGAPWLNELKDVGYDGSDVFTIKALMADSSLAHRSDGIVRLAWLKVPDFSFTGQDALLENLASVYKTKRSVALYSIGLPTNIHTLRDLNVIYQPYNQGTAMSMQYISTAIDAGEPLRPAMAKLPDRAGIDEVIVFMFAQRAFPEVTQGKQPYDEAWIPSLVFPPPQLKRMTGSYDSTLKVYGTDYHSPRRATSPAEERQSRKPPLSLAPRVRLLANGVGKQQLELHPGPDTANWVLEGDRLGRLEKEGSTRYYYPPATVQPAVKLDDNNKTGRPAAVISTLPKRFTVDEVKATQGQESAYSTFATYYAPATHYFKAFLDNGKFKLALWHYLPDQGKAIQVPDKDIEWGIASGNGTVSSAGLFTPHASKPSPFTLVWAQDKTVSELLLWAYTVIPIPFYSPAEAVDLYQG